MLTAICSAIHAKTRFACNELGSITLMTGVMLPLIFLLAGGATDISRIYSIQTKAQRTLDAAVLSMARSGMTNEEIVERGPKFWASQL